MKLKDCISLAAQFLDETETADALAAGTADDEQAALIERLTVCANLVLDEIAAEYYPIKKQKTVTVTGGFLPLSALDALAVEVFCLTDEGQRKAHFTPRADGAEAEDGTYTVTYSALPGTLTPDSPLPFSSRISARLIGYGTAAEYAMMNGMSEEAVLYDKRYKDALHNAGFSRVERKIKRRRWL